MLVHQLKMHLKIFCTRMLVYPEIHTQLFHALDVAGCLCVCVCVCVRLRARVCACVAFFLNLHKLSFFLGGDDN